MEKITLDKYQEISLFVSKLDKDQAINVMNDLETPEFTKDRLSLFFKIVKNVDYDGFISWVERGELPAISLSDKEMALISGGHEWPVSYRIGVAIGNFIKNKTVLYCGPSAPIIY